MARVEVTFCEAGNRSSEGASMAMIHGGKAKTEVLNSAASSVATTTRSEAPDGYGVVMLWCESDVWVTTGDSPVAAVPGVGQVGNGCRLTAYQYGYLAVRKGDRVAVINI